MKKISSHSSMVSPFKKFFLLLGVITSFCSNTLFSQQTYSFGQSSSPVTLTEYTEFLNCVATTDTYGLYNEKMGEDQGDGALITRSGTPGNYIYVCNVQKSFFPVTYVPWISAVRYCNWKSHNGLVGLQDSATTETGSYDLAAFDQGVDISTVTLMPGAKFFLPANYLIDVANGEGINSDQSCDPYLASNHLGFCIATWDSNMGINGEGNGGGVSPSGGLVFGGNGAVSWNGNNDVLGNLIGPSSGLKTRDVTLKSSGASIMKAGGLNTDTNQININLVLVGAPNNLPDHSGTNNIGTNSAGTNNVGYGAVLMPYRIGKYDVTADEYCAFLNAVAKKNDLHQLYNTNMTADPDVACITRSGDANSGFTYVPINGREKFPVTYVSWWSAVRFCNWLENGQPVGEQDAKTTESGAFSIATGHPVDGAAWSLPTEDQWYKAAYYVSLGNNIPGKYCVFGTASMDAPMNKLEEAVVANRANYCLGGAFTTTTQPRLTPVGTFVHSTSPWGAYDMAGEVNQWTSTFADTEETKLVLRGGSWKSQTSDELKSTARFTDPGYASPTVGFRVVYNIPPPPIITHLDMKKDLVVVDHPNNAPSIPAVEGELRYGAVSTVYQISKYDVTAEQYCTFLNAVAAHADPHNLYDPQMAADSNVACIIRYGNTNIGFSYYPWPGREKFPITYVNWYSSLRFCNWLENDQPVGDESPTTTEAGSFNCNGEGVFSIATNNPKWLLPTEDQWYKAAYYCPPGTESSEGFYYYFSDSSSQSAPANTLEAVMKGFHAANYCLNNVFTTATEPRLTPVGIFSNTTSPCGAYDMGGNVNQWTLTPAATGVSDAKEGSDNIIVRGCSWQSTNYRDLSSGKRSYLKASEGNSIVGFRVIYNAAPPDPTIVQSFGTKIKYAGNTIWDDVTTAPMKIFTNTGEWFFNFMYYTIGGSIGEMLAKSYNWLTSFLNTILSSLLQKIEAYFGVEIGNWFSGWLRTIYQILLEPIKSSKLTELELNARAARCKQAIAEGEVVMKNFALRFAGAANSAVVSPEVLAGVEQASEALAAADAAVASTTAAVATETAALAFFASPAAAVVVPLGLLIGGYEVLSYELANPNRNNDPRIGLGMLIDAIVRYAIPAIRLL